MLQIGPDGNLLPASGNTPPPPQIFEDRDASPKYQPGDHIYPWALGDGIRNTIPLKVLEGWHRPDDERTFEMRQNTVAERCSAFRLALIDGELDERERMRVQIEYAIRKVGQHDKLSNEFMAQWFEDIGLQGYALLVRQWQTLHFATMVDQHEFEQSMVKDVFERTWKFRIPAAAVPRKRWAVRTHKESRWVPAVYGKDDKGEDKLLTPGFWTVDGAPVDQPTAAELSRDLSFTMQEIKVKSYGQISNIMDDPDDGYATRQMEVMFSVVEIGGRRVGNNAADLAFKRCWLEDIGPRAVLMVSGMYAKTHEVDQALIASFPASATPLE